MVGFALYYYIIKHLNAARVSLITLVTLVLALLLGHLLNGEIIAPRLWLGAATILGGWRCTSGGASPVAAGWSWLAHRLMRLDDNAHRTMGVVLPDDGSGMRLSIALI